MELAEERRQRRAAAVRPLFAFVNARGIMRLWLAQRLGISKQRLHLIERGERPAPEWFMERSCEVLGIPVELLGIQVRRPTAQPRRKSKIVA